MESDKKVELTVTPKTQQEVQRLYVMVNLPRSTASQPTDKIELEKLRKTLLQAHERAGHIGISTMKAFLKRKGCPDWLLDMVDELKCDACQEFGNRPGAQPVSLLRPPRLWQCTGMDAWELTKGPIKQYFVIHADIACRMAAVSKLSEELPLRRVFVPSTTSVIDAFTGGWLQHKPKPEWLMADPATCFTSNEFAEFTSRQGFGLFITAGEAHWMLGSVEGLLRAIKLSAQRILASMPGLALYTAACLAVAAHNVHDRVGGYSPAQWAFEHYAEMSSDSTPPAE